MDSNFTDLKDETMDNELLEKVEDLLRISTENVSANHWVPAIHEDKHEGLAQELVKLLAIHNVVHRRDLLLAAICEYNKYNTQKDIKAVDDWLKNWDSK